MRLRHILLEANGEEPLSVPTLTFRYANYKEDPEPTIFYLGRGIQPQTGNRIIGGLNLNYIRTRGPRVVEDLLRVNLPVLLQAGAIAPWPRPGNLQAAFEAIVRMLDNAVGATQVPSQQVMGYSPYKSQGVYRTYLIDEMETPRETEPIVAISQDEYETQRAARDDQATQAAQIAQQQADQAAQAGKAEIQRTVPDVVPTPDEVELDLDLGGEEELEPEEPQAPPEPAPEEEETPPEEPPTSPQRRRFR